MWRYFKGARVIGLAIAFLVPAMALAQQTKTGGITLPESSGQTCVQVAVPGETPSVYNCLNQELQRDAQGSANPQAGPPLSATSPSNQTGTFNEQSLSEQYGKNFGKSVIPFRPPPPVFNNALSPVH